MDPTAVISSQDQWTRVVVLAPPATEVSTVAPTGITSLSPILQAEFARRDWFAIEHYDPYLALAELCLRERAQTARAAWGLQRMERIALVILDPDRWPAGMVASLALAVHRNLPDAGVHTAGDDRIEAVTPAAAVEPVQPRRANMPAQVPTATRANGVEADADEADRPAPSVKASTSDEHGDRLSRDEIEMLLHLDQSPNANAGIMEGRR